MTYSRQCQQCQFSYVCSFGSRCAGGCSSLSGLKSELQLLGVSSGWIAQLLVLWCFMIAHVHSTSFHTTNTPHWLHSNLRFVTYGTFFNSYVPALHRVEAWWHTQYQQLISYRMYYIYYLLFAQTALKLSHNSQSNHTGTSASLWPLLFSTVCTSYKLGIVVGTVILIDRNDLLFAVPSSHSDSISCSALMQTWKLS